MSELGYAVAGLGRIAARHMSAVDEMEGARLVAVADVNIEKARDVAANHPGSPAAHADWRELVADDDVDVLMVCVPTQLHAEVAVAAMDAGKRVLCEKPMAPSARQCREMIAARDRSGVKLMIGQSTRFQPAYAMAARLVERGEIGTPVAAQAQFAVSATQPDDVPADFWRFKAGATGHGYVLNFGCHYIDTARAIVGADPVSVTARVGNRFSEGVIPEDHCVVLARCEPDVDITVSIYGVPGAAASCGSGYTILGTDGVIEARSQAAPLQLCRAGESPVAVEIDDDLRGASAWQRYHRLFRDCILNDTREPVTGEDGMLNVEWGLAAYLASEQRRCIDLPLADEHADFCGPRLDGTIPPADLP